MTRFVRLGYENAESCAESNSVTWVPTLPGEVINVTVWVSIKGTGVGIRGRGLRREGRGAHLITVSIDLIVAMVMAVAVVRLPVHHVLRGGMVRVSVTVAMHPTVTIGVVRGGRAHRCRRGASRFKTPGHQLSALPVIHFRLRRTNRPRNRTPHPLPQKRPRTPEPLEPLPRRPLSHPPRNPTQIPQGLATPAFRLRFTRTQHGASHWPTKTVALRWWMRRV